MAAQEPSLPLVLVVDDEDYVADMLATAFEMSGYLVQVAYNGREGLERARASAPDLLIIDIMLPYLNGIDLVNELRRMEHLRSVPVMLISAGARPRQALPRVSFITKPFDLDEVLALADRYLNAEGSTP